MNPADEKLYTYQDLATLFKVSQSTVRRWFKKCRGQFRPTHQTVRIYATAFTEPEVTAFLKKHLKKYGKK